MKVRPRRYAYQVASRHMKAIIRGAAAAMSGLIGERMGMVILVYKDGEPELGVAVGMCGRKTIAATALRHVLHEVSPR